MNVLNSKTILLMLLAVCLSFSSCVKDGGVSPKVLEGKWNIKLIDGEPADEDFYWEFDEDGNFNYCEDNECEHGTWEWNNDKSEIDIDYTDEFGNDFNVELEVDVLDKKTLKGSINVLWFFADYEFERD